MSAQLVCALVILAALVACVPGRNTATGRLTPEVAATGPFLYLRAIKDERVLEAWLAQEPEGPFQLFKTWNVAAMSGALGPKRREGDRQVPEGLYVVDRFNPNSRYHLSLGLDYPNASDRILGDPQRPGSDIFIHGSNVSIGCLAMTDPVIEEIYGLAERAKQAGQKAIRVDLFPFRLTDKRIQDMALQHPEFAEFWRGLAPFYTAFEETRSPAKFSVLKDGSYVAQ